MIPSMIIRRAGPDDAKTIATFNIAMALETEDKILPRKKILAGVNRLMNMPDHGFYIVAEQDGETVGCQRYGDRATDTAARPGDQHAPRRGRLMRHCRTSRPSLHGFRADRR